MLKLLGVLIRMSPVLFVVGMVLFGGWHPASLILTLVPGIFCFIWTFFYVSDWKELDPNRLQYENILSLLRGYPDDWVRENRRYSLHENVIIFADDGSIVIHVFDPKSNGRKPRSFTTYRPNREYERAIHDTLDNLQQYEELKRFVSVTQHAERHKKPLDEARKALEDFRIRADLGDPSAIAAINQVEN